jgi:hypothetical protein
MRPCATSIAEEYSRILPPASPILSPGELLHHCAQFGGLPFKDSLWTLGLSFDAVDIVSLMLVGVSSCRRAFWGVSDGSREKDSEDCLRR